MALIELKNVYKVYKLGKVEVKALNGINLKIERSENLAILGPSGCGKSTLLNLIGCLDRPTKGKVFFDGRDVSSLSDDELARIRREKIGFVFQFFYLLPHLSVLENVILPMTFLGVSEERRKKRARELLKLLGLEKRENHRPMELSGGERQRVAIARAMANNPSIILADEPTGNLDSKTGKQIIDILFSLNKKSKVTLVMVTHDERIASRAERIIYLKDGRIIKERRRK